MSEPIIEQIADWINDAIDGKQDPDLTLTLASVRPGMEQWDDTSFAHGDCVIENDSLATVGFTSETREERATFKVYGFIVTLPSAVGLDTVMSRMSETIRRNLLAGNSAGRACGGIATHINCPSVVYAPGPMVIVTVDVDYDTSYTDGFSQ